MEAPVRGGTPLMRVRMGPVHKNQSTSAEEPSERTQLSSGRSREQGVDDNP